MDENQQIELLKKLLRDEVSSFCRHDDIGWRSSISKTIEEIRKQEWCAVFFGGTLRSLLLSRINSNEPGRPRDIDIVMVGASLQEMRNSFEPYISRQTRFGGLQLKRVNWQFDVWPLEETYAFKERGIQSPDLEDLPSTTFFNVEAVAVEVWPKRGHARKIFSGDDQFFRGVIDRTIEINREANPFPELCVVRALVMAANLKWKVGSRLLSYLENHGHAMSPADFEAIQEKHYGKVQWPASLFKKAMEEVHSAIARKESGAVELTLPGQLTFWPENEIYQQRIHLRTLRRPKRSVREPAASLGRSQGSASSD